MPDAHGKFSREHQSHRTIISTSDDASCGISGTISSQSKWLAFGLAIGAAILVALVHWPALHAKVTAFDDRQYLFDNLYVQSPGWASTWKFLSEVSCPSTVGGYYQPFTMISLMLDSALGGGPEHLMPYHRTSLILHALNSLLVVVLIYQLFGRPWIAAAVGLLFGLHPMTVEPIPWIGERKTLLAAFFALASLVFYVRHAQAASRRGWLQRMALPASVLCYLFALLSKPISVPLVAVLILLDFWPLRRLKKRTLREKIPFLILAGVFAIITVVSQGKSGGVSTPVERNIATILYILSHNIVFYLYKIVWPFNLTTHYPFPKPLSPAHPMVLAGVICAPILVAAILASIRRTRVFAVGALIFFIMILPTMGIIGFTIVLTSDKYAYLPAVGLLLIVAWLLIRISSPPATAPSTIRRFAVTLVVLGLLVAEAFITRHQLGHWKDSVTFSRHMAGIAPDSAAVQNVLGTSLFDAGRLEEALAAFSKALELDPAHMEALYNKGNTYQKLKRYDEAIQTYRQVIQIDPQAVSSRINLAITLETLDRYPEAIEQYKTAIRLKSSTFRYHYLYARCLLSAGQPEQAAEEYRQSLQLLPAAADHVTLYNNLGYALLQAGKSREAVECFRKAIELKPQEPMCYLNLADAYKESGHLDEAIRNYEMTIRLKPDEVEAHYGLGNAWMKLNRTPEAVQSYRRVLQLDPRHDPARKRLDEIQAGGTALPPQPGMPTAEK